MQFPLSSRYHLSYFVWRVRGKIIRTVLGALLCMTVVHNDIHTHKSSSYKISVVLGLDLVLCICLGLAFYVFFSGLA